MAKQKVPGSREEESWFSEEQLENLELADEVEDDLRSPIPTQTVSNGEYLPTPQTPEQNQVERRIREARQQRDRARIEISPYLEAEKRKRACDRGDGRKTHQAAGMMPRHRGIEDRAHG